MQFHIKFRHLFHLLKETNDYCMKKALMEKLWQAIHQCVSTVSTLSLDHYFHEEVKAGQECYHSHFIFFRGHCGLLDAFSLALACAIRISAYVKRHMLLLGFNSLIVESCKSFQQLDCKENWIYAYRIQQFSQNDYPSSIDL